MKRKGGEIPVDNDRDINPRHFSKILRQLLAPILEPSSWKSEQGNWRFGELMMHRRAEPVGLYQGELTLNSMPGKLAGIVVTGSLTIGDNTQIECDIWCLGDVTVGKKCNLRSIAADGFIRVGEKTVVERWLDAGTSLFLASSVSIVACASASQEVLLGPGFKGGKVYAPIIQINVNVNEALEALQEVAATTENHLKEDIVDKIYYWTSMRSSLNTISYRLDTNNKVQWIKEKSVNTTGDYSVGPNTVVLHDVICNGSVHVGTNCIIVGSIHAGKDLYLSMESLVTGNLACENLFVEEEVTVVGSIHVAGDAVINEHAVLGLTQKEGGIAVTGSIRFKDRVTVSHGIFAGDAIYTL